MRVAGGASEDTKVRGPSTPQPLQHRQVPAREKGCGEVVRLRHPGRNSTRRSPRITALFTLGRERSTQALPSSSAGPRAGDMAVGSLRER